MRSAGTAEFWKLYYQLPAHIRAQAPQAYKLFHDNPDHPSLRFKKLKGDDSLWSVRFGNGYRAVGLRKGEDIVWGWIGIHAGYDKEI